MASEPDSPRDFGPFNTSATPTPLHTRSASPFQGTSMPHTPHEASQTMHRMRALFERRYEEDPNTVYLVDELPPLTEPEPVSSTNSNKPEQTKKERRLVPELDGTENVPDAVKYRYLALYLALNVGLTFLNKSTMIKVCFLMAFPSGCCVMYESVIPQDDICTILVYVFGTNAIRSTYFAHGSLCALGFPVKPGMLTLHNWLCLNERTDLM